MIRIDMDRNCSKYAVNCVNRQVSFLLYPAIHPASSEAGFSSFMGEKLAFCLLFSVFCNFSVYFSVKFAGS